MKEDQAQYNMRLNLNDQKHLIIHKALMNLDKKKYKSRNQFIIESVFRNITEPVTEEKDTVTYVTVEDLKQMENRLRNEMMQMIIRAVSDNNNHSVTDLTRSIHELLSSGAFVQASQQADEEENTESEPIDSALLEVAGNYF